MPPEVEIDPNGTFLHNPRTSIHLLPLPRTILPRSGRPDPLTSAARLGAFVRARRKAARLTQGRLGELAGVGVRFIVEMEGGKPTMRLDRVNAVLAVFGKEAGVVDAPREAS